MTLIKNFQSFYKHEDRFIFWPISISVLLGCIITFIWAISLTSLPPQLPLFYSLPWGEPQLGSVYQFLVLPSVILIVILINSIISIQLHDSQLVIKRILAITSLIVSIIISVTALRIIYTFT